MRKTIWTFWEPKEKIPAYIALCMQTWKIFLSDYEIVLLDYSNLDEYLGKDYFDESFKNNFSLAKQADAIRAAILSKFGGIWFDADTVISSSKVRKFLTFKENMAIISRHIGFLACNTKSLIMQNYAREAKERILLYKNYKEIFGKTTAEFEAYYYLGNGPCNKFINHFLKNKNELMEFDRTKDKIILESYYNATHKLHQEATKQYLNFYFFNDFSQWFFQNENGLVMLHNSWTPSEFKSMSKKEFLSQNCTLSKVLYELNKEKLQNLTLKESQKTYSQEQINAIYTEISDKELPIQDTDFYDKWLVLEKSAVARIKHSLAYRLGTIIVENANHFLGYIKIPYILAFEALKYQFQTRKEKRLQLQYNLEFSKIENCEDYALALETKKHLSYQLGIALLESSKRKMGGGIIKFLLFDAKKIKKKWRQI